MTGKKTWIWEAQPEEQGDFCDRASQHEYQSGNLTDAVEAETETHDRGEEVVWIDAAIDQDTVYEVRPGQQFNRWESSRDGQGVNYPRRK